MIASYPREIAMLVCATVLTSVKRIGIPVGLG